MFEIGKPSRQITSLSTIPADTRAEAHFLAKDTGVLSGLLVAERVFKTVDPSLVVHWSARDGDAIRKGVQFGPILLHFSKLCFLQRTCSCQVKAMSDRDWHGISPSRHDCRIN
jgi:nicotinate-nucleotide pyrophosphorylase